MKNIYNKLLAFLVDEEGAETVEWVMIAAVLATVIIAAFNTSLKGSVTGAMTAITGDITTITSG